MPIDRCDKLGSSFTKTHATFVNISEVTDDQKVSNGGGLEEEDEMIEVVEMSIEEFRKYLNQKELKTDGAKLHGMYWFLANKARDLETSSS